MPRAASFPGSPSRPRSPALIEGVRTAITDSAGQYRIVDLRPGVYTVTFTMTGFSVVTRTGIELVANFTAPINADMRVGGLEETITVSGASPVVDLQSSTQQQVMTQELLESVPTGRSIWAVGSTLNGVTLSAPDVGGTAGMQQTYMATHGSDRRDNAIQVDGMSVNGIEGDGAIQNYFNQGMFEEMSYQTSALSAEVPSAGVRLNMIPKDGSNAFRGSLFYTQTPSSFQSNNFTPELAALGLKAPNRVEKIIDFNPALGGPVLKSKLWFFTSQRFWGVDQTVTDSFYNADTTQRTFQPDLSRPTVDDNLIKSGMLRLTYQMSPQAQVRRLRRRHHQVPRPRVRHQHLPDRRGLRHPQPQALLHGAGRSTPARSPTTCCSRAAGRRTTRPIPPTRSRTTRRRPTSAGSTADHRSVELGDRPVLLPRARSATPSRARRPTSPGRMR